MKINIIKILKTVIKVADTIKKIGDLIGLGVEYTSDSKIKSVNIEKSINDALSETPNTTIKRHVSQIDNISNTEINRYNNIQDLIRNL